MDDKDTGPESNRDNARRHPIGSIGDAIELVRPFFDANRYKIEYPDVIGDDEQLLLHFCRRGWKEGRNPNAGFDTVYYLERHPDVAAVGWNPYYHFILQGYRENRRIVPAFMPRESSKAVLGQHVDDWVSILQPIVDGTYYRSQFKVPLEAAVNPVAHFAFRGWLDCKNPNASVSIINIICSHPELYSERVNPMLLEIIGYVEVIKN